MKKLIISIISLLALLMSVRAQEAPNPYCPNECAANPITYTSGSNQPPAGVVVVWQFTSSTSGWAPHMTCNTCQGLECRGTLRFAIYGTSGVHCVTYGIGTGQIPPGHLPTALSTGARDFPFVVACNGTPFVFEMGVSLCPTDPPQYSPQYVVGATFECLCVD